MKLLFVIVALVLLLASGCAVASSTVRTFDPTTRVVTVKTARLIAILNKSAVTGFKAGYQTKSSETLLGIANATTESQEEVIEKITEGVVAGLVKGIK